MVGHYYMDVTFFFMMIINKKIIRIKWVNSNGLFKIKPKFLEITFETGIKLLNLLIPL